MAPCPPAPCSTIKIAYVSAWTTKRSTLVAVASSSRAEATAGARKASSRPGLVLGNIMAARSKVLAGGEIEGDRKIMLE
eukprot:763286-Hanusia_phi.AAC.1